MREYPATRPVEFPTEALIFLKKKLIRNIKLVEDLLYKKLEFTYFFIFKKSWFDIFFIYKTSKFPLSMLKSIDFYIAI